MAKPEKQICDETQIILHLFMALIMGVFIGMSFISESSSVESSLTTQAANHKKMMIGIIEQLRTELISFDDKDISTKYTALMSKVMSNGNGRVKFPINVPAPGLKKSQIEEYLRDYKGEGIQHIALGTNDLYAGVDQLAANGIQFMPTPPDTYYESSHKRVPGHAEPVAKMQEHGILLDGEGVVEADGAERPSTRILLQIFSKTVVGPIFFEFIQRKGDDGFGEGNVRALFESIEEDQIRRGVIAPAA